MAEGSPSTLQSSSQEESSHSVEDKVFHTLKWDGSHLGKQWKLLEHLTCCVFIVGCCVTRKGGILTGIRGTLMLQVSFPECVNCITCLRSFPMKTALGAYLIVADVPSIYFYILFVFIKGQSRVAGNQFSRLLSVLKMKVFQSACQGHSSYLQKEQEFLFTDYF